MTVSTPTPDTVTVFKEGNLSSVVVRGQGDVVVRANPDDILTVNRVGNDLVVDLKNGEAFKIDGYFANETGIDLFFTGYDGKELLLKEVRGGGQSPLLLHFEDVAAIGGDGVGALGILGALGLLGATAALAGGDDGDRDADADADAEAVDDQTLVALEVTPVVSEQGQVIGSTGGLLNVGALGDTVNIALLSGSTAFTVDVATNTTQQISVTGGGTELLGVDLAGDNDLDLFVYRQEAGSSDATLAFTQTDWLAYTPGILGLLGSWEGNDLTLPELTGGATYFFVVGNDGGLGDLGLLTNIMVATSANELTDYRSPAEVSGTVSGNVILGDGGGGADTIPVGSVVSTVDGTPVLVGGTVIVGTYGTLTIQPDGGYVYVANDTFAGEYGDISSFSYTITAPEGQTSTASLDITHEIEPIIPVVLGFAAAAEGPGFGEGADILSYDFLGDGSDTVDNFDLTQGDAVDLSGLLPEETAETLDLYVSVMQVEGDTLISVDPEGGGDFAPLVTLTGVIHTLDELEEGMLGTPVV